MKTKQYEHGRAFEHAFTVYLRGEIDRQPCGWGCAKHEKKWLEDSLREVVKEAVARYYQCRLNGTAITVSFPNGQAAALAAVPAAGWKRCTDEMPDSDSTVMIHHAEEDEPVWMGYHDGETWRLVDGTRCAVTHWMPLPEPPNDALCRPADSEAGAQKGQSK